MVVKRSCASKPKGGESDECKPIDQPSFVKTVFCQTCEENGCNADISTDYASLSGDFPSKELHQYTPKPDDHVPNNQDNEEEYYSNVDDIGKDADRHGNLVTHPDRATEKVHHNPDPEMYDPKGNSAERIFSSSCIVALVSAAVLIVTACSQ